MQRFDAQVDILAQRLKSIFLDRLAHWREEGVARPHAFAADDDERRVEQINDIGNRSPKDRACLFQDAQGDGVACVGSAHQIVRREDAQAVERTVAQQPCIADERLQAAATAAVAQRSMGIDIGVSELARAAARAAMASSGSSKSAQRGKSLALTPRKLGLSVRQPTPGAWAAWISSALMPSNQS